MNKYTFYCGTGSTLTVEAQTVEEAIQKLYPEPWPEIEAERTAKSA
jgi:hypothetical protein